MDRKAIGKGLVYPRQPCLRWVPQWRRQTVPAVVAPGARAEVHGRKETGLAKYIVGERLEYKHEGLEVRYEFNG